MAGEALSVLVFLFLLQPMVSDTRSEFEPVAKSWWIEKSVVSVQSKNLEKAVILLGEPRAEKRKEGASNSPWDRMS